MILPIYVYGARNLEEETIPVEANSPELQQLIDDMFETMAGAAGIGLAAPQVGRSERLFVIDLSPMADDKAGDEVGPMVFINPEIIDESELEEEFEEGCLSIPDIREYVSRPASITVKYLDRDFNEHVIDADGMLARVIQHEYDHLLGVLFVDYLSPFRRRLLRRRLRDMADGRVEADYPLYISEKQV